MPTVAVNGTTLSYEDHGPRDADAAPLLLSHSLFFDRSMFVHQVERFAGERRVVTYDHRGQGASAPAPLDELGMDTLADDAAGLIDALEIDRPHVLGNSMGGFVALRLAARVPQLVRSAIAVSSSAAEEGKKAEFGPLVEAMQAGGQAELIDTLMWIMFGDTSLAGGEREALRDHWRARMLELPASIGDAAHAVVHRTGILDELAHAGVPVLAVGGEEDHAYEPPLSHQIAEVAPDGEVEVLDRCGHSASLERPDAVNAILERWFARVEAPTRSAA